MNDAGMNDAGMTDAGMTDAGMTDVAMNDGVIGRIGTWPGWRVVALVFTALFAGAGWTAIMLARLFQGGAVGRADQGDGRQLLCQLGVRALHPFGVDTTKFVYPTYVPHRWFGEACGADGSGEPFRSSQVALLHLAKVLTRPLGFPGALDLRALGVICAVAVGLVVTLLVFVVPGSLLVRLVLASLVGLIAADASVADYFISPYSEPAALIGILMMLVAVLWLWRNGESTWPRLTIVAGIGVFAMTARTQMVGLLPAVVLALLFQPCRRTPKPDDELRTPKWQRTHMSSRPGPVLTVVRFVVVRVPALMVCAMVIVASVFYVRATPRRITEVNAYNQVFSDILPNGSNPAKDLRTLGVDPALASSTGSTIIDTNSAGRQLSYLTFRNRITPLRVLKFYVVHPDRLGHLFGQGFRTMGMWRQSYLGSYLQGTSHPPGARECRICVISSVSSMAHEAPIMVPLLWLVTFLVGVSVVRDPRLGPTDRALGRLSIFLVVGAASELCMVLLTQGVVDLTLHLIVADFLTALCVPATFGSVLALWLQRDAVEVPTPIPQSSGPQRALFPSI